MILSMLKAFLIIIGAITVIACMIICWALCMIQKDDPFHDDNDPDDEQW